VVEETFKRASVQALSDVIKYEFGKHCGGCSTGRAL
jgi:hypothetical protein